jgi:predicted NAD/FAD-dependent oxidoreductase
LALPALTWLSGCDQHLSVSKTSALEGGWIGARLDRGHRLRNDPALAGAGFKGRAERRVHALVVGAGVAGLSAARALRLKGIEDVHVLDVEDTAGGNARSHQLGEMSCPLGAHYLPVPDTARPMSAPLAQLLVFLEEVGLARHELGRWRFEERHLCHAPQERLFIHGAWQEGLLPATEPGSVADQAYQRISEQIESWRKTQDFALSGLGLRWTPELAALDAISLGEWLRRQGLAGDESLSGYLDYCCRDDYGAGIDEVSAWAGVSYFASRHGFRPPFQGQDGSVEHEGVFTWPEGNAWLTRRLAEPLSHSAERRFHSGQVALAVQELRQGVAVAVWNTHSHQVETWWTRSLVLAVPLKVAARLWPQGPAALMREAGRVRQAPWLVANLQLSAPLLQRAGAAAAWDNVAWAPADRAFLGYVDAGHQRLDPRPVASVLTAYFALGESERAALAGADWQPWARRVLAAMTPLHPDLPDKLLRIDLMRYGHAMRIPVPGTRNASDLQGLQGLLPGPIQLAHADLAGFSIFEAAFEAGSRLRDWKMP